MEEKNMSFLDIAKSRCSVRTYTTQPVEEEKLQKILIAAHVAPTAANFQPVHIIVVRKKEGLERIGKAANIYHAPLALIICADKAKAWSRPFDGMKTTEIDASILTDHMMLEATELGLGSVWIGCFKPDVLKEEFQLPKQLEPVSILAIGYTNAPPADPERHASTRIPLEELVSYEAL